MEDEFFEEPPREFVVKYGHIYRRDRPGLPERFRIGLRKRFKLLSPLLRAILVWLMPMLVLMSVLIVAVSWSAGFAFAGEVVLGIASPFDNDKAALARVLAPLLALLGWLAGPAIVGAVIAALLNEQIRPLSRREVRRRMSARLPRTERANAVW